MKTIIAVLLLALALPAYGADRRTEQDARRVCMEQARARGHNVSDASSISRNGRNDYNVALRVQGVREPLMCYYDQRSGGAELEWRSGGGPAYGTNRGGLASARGGEGDARRVCMEQARASGHNVNGVRSISKNGRDDYRLMLGVDGVRQQLVCHYDQRSGGAELEWGSARR
jgi:hypothetical protein